MSSLTNVIIVAQKFNKVIFQKEMFDLDYVCKIRDFDSRYCLVVVQCKESETTYVSNFLTDIYNKLELQKN